MSRACAKCETEMVLDCEVYSRISTDQGIGLGIKKKIGKGIFSKRVHRVVKVAICPECGTIEYYAENPKEFL